MRTVFTVLDLPATRVRGIPHQHKILVYAHKLRILEYPALWLSEKEYTTGERYAKSLQRFSNYLAAKVFIHDEKILLEWWFHVNKETLIAWKRSRIEKRRRDEIAKPSNPHIDVDAHDVFVFLNWLKFDKGLLGMRWDGTQKTILTKSNNLASPTAGMFGPNTREVSNDTTRSSAPYDSDEDINVSTAEIEASASEKQFEGYAYLSNVQVKEVVDTCSDKVYKYILLTGYMTGLRTHEVLAVPRYEVYSNGTTFSAEPTFIGKEIDKIASHNEKKMDEFRKKNEELVKVGEKPLKNLPSRPKLFQMIKKTLGKRNKLRLVRFNLYAWQKVMEGWWPLYNERKKLYETKYGRLPMHILWLDKKGEPIYAPPGRDNARWRSKPVQKAQDAFRYVGNLLKSKSEEFEGIYFSYYCIRHTYATNYILRLMLAEGVEKTRDQWLTDLRVRAFLAVQLGHDDVNTTYNYYVDKAMLMYLDMGKGWEKREFDFIEQLLGETTTSQRQAQTVCPI
jgi:integrase